MKFGFLDDYKSQFCAILSNVLGVQDREGSMNQFVSASALNVESHEWLVLLGIVLRFMQN